MQYFSHLPCFINATQKFQSVKKTLKRELFLSQETIQAKVGELAQQISTDYAGKDPVLVGILNGVVFFFTDLIIAMSIPSKMDFMRAASYGSGTTSSGHVKLTKDVEIPLAGKHVIIVEDIVDTGLTLNRIVGIIKERDPESVKICALIDKFILLFKIPFVNKSKERRNF